MKFINKTVIASSIALFGLTSAAEAQRPTRPSDQTAHPTVGLKRLPSQAEVTRQPADASAVLSAKSVSKKATRDEILGTYIYDEFRYANAHTGWDYLYCIPEIVAGDADNEVILLGFWADYDTSYDPPVPISQVKATFDYESQTLSIPAGTSLGKYGYYSAYLYVSDWATDILQPDPIVLKINSETREISYYCDRTDNDWMKPQNCLIVTSYPDAVGTKVDKGVDFIGAIVMNKYNGIMGVNGPSLNETAYSAIYTVGAGNEFTVYNFGGYGFDTGVTFTIDPSSSTCSAPATPITNQAAGAAMIASTTGGEITGTVTASQSGATSIAIPSWAIYDADNQKVLTEYTSSIFDIDLGLAAITAPVQDASGPVIYYDLQGNRIAEPARGSVTIGIENGKARKFILR